MQFRNTVGIGLAGAPSAQLDINTGAVGTKGLIVGGVTGQTANLHEWQVNGVQVARVTANGSVVTVSGGSDTAYIDATAGIFRGGGLTTYANTGTYIDLSNTGVRVTGRTDVAQFQVRANGTQTGDLVQLVNSAGSVATRFDASGYLGIGVAPVEKLQVGAGNLLLDNNFSLKWKDAGGTARRLVLCASSGTVYFGDIDNANNTPLILAAGGNQPVLLYANGAERFRVNANGSVAIAGGTATVNSGYIVQDWSTGSATNAPEHHFYGRSGRWLIGVDVANTVQSRDFVLAGVLGTYAFDDAATTSGSATLTSAAQGGFAASMVGAALSGAGIPVGTTVSSVSSATSLTMSANATATASSVRVTVTQNTVGDILYLKHRGALSPTFGVGVTPPDGSYRQQIAASASEPAMGGLGIVIGASQTGHALAVHDSANTARVWIDKDGYHGGNHAATGAAVAMKADATNRRALVFANSDGSSFYGFYYPGAGSEMRLRYFTGGADIAQFASNASSYWYGAMTVAGYLDAATAGIRTKHVAAATPTGGNSGDVAVGTGKIWVNDGGTWNSATLGSSGGTIGFKQVEINAGAVPTLDYEVYVTDAAVSATSRVVAQISNDAPTGKDADDAQMDTYVINTYPEAGQFLLKLHAIDGPLEGYYKIDYMIGVKV